jgi:dethiobiotin synthetase
MTRKFFITGTDTDVGKTFCSCALTCAIRDKGFSVRPFKPIVSGLEDGINHDLMMHLKYAQIKGNMYDISAYVFDEPIAPHIAALNNKIDIKFEKLNEQLDKSLGFKSDFLVVEGAGGWALPLDNQKLLSDWPRLAEMEIILVVGMKLGCLNHALLTVRDIKARGYNFKGFLTHSVQPQKMKYYEENLESLKNLIGEEYFLGDIKYYDVEDPQLAKKDILYDRIINAIR